MSTKIHTGQDMCPENTYLFKYGVYSNAYLTESAYLEEGKSQAKLVNILKN